MYAKTKGYNTAAATCLPRRIKIMCMERLLCFRIQLHITWQRIHILTAWKLKIIFSNQIRKCQLYRKPESVNSSIKQ